jgi:hypothetical protein
MLDVCPLVREAEKGISFFRAQRKKLALLGHALSFGGRIPANVVFGSDSVRTRIRRDSEGFGWCLPTNPQSPAIN